MRNYQTKKNNPYYIPHNVYMQVLYKIKDYERLKQEQREILHASPPPLDGMPRGKGVGDPTMAKAVRLANLSRQIEAIEESMAEMTGRWSGRVYEGFDCYKAFFNEAYFNYMHIREDESDAGPSRRTWNNFKSQLSIRIAQKLQLI